MRSAVIDSQQTRDVAELLRALDLADRMPVAEQTQAVAPALHKRSGTTRTLIGLAVAFVVAVFMVNSNRETAGALGSEYSVTPVSPVGRIDVINGDPATEVRIVVNGAVQIPRLPPATKSSFVLDPGSYRFLVEPVSASSQALDPTRGSPFDVEAGETLTLQTTASSVALVSRRVGPPPTIRVVTASERRKALNAAQGHLSRPLRRVTPDSVVTALLVLSGIGALVVSQFMIERGRVRDVRASVRMQSMASRSLSSLPPLSMDLAARRGAPTP